jgi:hypothetical protein
MSSEVSKDHFPSGVQRLRYILKSQGVWVMLVVDVGHAHKISGINRHRKNSKFIIGEQSPFT